MKVKRVLLKNFRCFESAEIEFEKCHALVGENGCGKTAVLEAINHASSGGALYLNEQDFNNSDKGNLSIEVFFDELFLVRVPDGYITQDIPCKSIFLSAHRREKAAQGKALSDPFVIDRHAVPVIYSKQNEISLEGIEKSGLNIPASIKKTEKGYESPRKTGSKFQFTNQRLGLQNDIVNLPHIFYFDRNREEESKVGFNSLLQKIAKDLNWRYRNKWDQSQIISKWRDFYNQVIVTIDEAKNSRVIKPIQEKMNSLVGFDFNDLELSILDIEQPFSKSFFARRNNTNQIDQKRLGSGLSILLSYFLLETISKLSKEKIIFLIDEPELHLHPQLQKKLFNEFKTSDLQVIYTTQSDCFIDLSEWKSVSRFLTNFSVVPLKQKLQNEIDKITTENHLNEIKKWHQHETIFFREDNQIFFARKCLLVEGPAEKYGIPILAKTLDKNIGDITIISCNGKTKIPYYQLLCKAFEIPFFTLFDLDSKTKEVGDNKRPYSWANDKTIKTFSTSFENLLGIDNSEHKTSKLLIKIDELKKDKIPPEISDAINSISEWANKS